MTTLLIATRNAHKTQEIRQILSEQFQYLTLNDFPGAPAVAEDAPTFEGNAKKKSVALAQWLVENPQVLLRQVGPSDVSLFVLADDSGLEVDALRGSPGVHSARFASMDIGAAGNSPDPANNAKLLRLLEKVPEEERKARFRCVIAATRIVYSTMARKVMPLTEQQTALFTGVCEGRIGFDPSGEGGFGYDPLFIPSGHSESFAELGPEIKNRLSHRALALARLKQFLLRHAGL